MRTTKGPSNLMFPGFPGPNLNSDILIDYIVDTRGGDRSMWQNVADMIAYHETGPHQRMDPRARQITEGGGQGPGRGLFQFEDSTASGSFDTAKQRYRNTIDAVRDRGYVLNLDPDIMSASNADELTEDQQRAIFYANLIQGPASLKDYAEGNMSLEDLWLKGHKLVEKEGNRGSFRESVSDAKEREEPLETVTRENGGRVVKYQHGGKHDGGDEKKPGDVYRRDTDPSQEFLNEAALNRREFEGGRGAQRFGSRPDPREGIQRGAANPYYIKEANEYYRDVYSDPEVIAKIAEQIHIPYPDSFLQKVGDYIYDNYDYLGSILASSGFMPTDLNDHRLDDLEYEYPDAGVYDNPRTKEEADQKRQALAELLARRRRDIMSSNSDMFFSPDLPENGGYASPNPSSAGSEQNPYWMGLSTIQNRGTNQLQVDGRRGIRSELGTTTHEMSHAQDRGGRYLTDGFIDYVGKNKKSEEEAALNKDDGLRGNYRYLTRPTEVMARLNDVRERMYRDGGYRRWEDVPFEVKSYIVKSSSGLKDLQSVFGDEEIVEMINNYYDKGGRVSDKIRVLKKEGKPQKQAVAIALDMLKRGKL